MHNLASVAGINDINGKRVKVTSSLSKNRRNAIAPLSDGWPGENATSAAVSDGRDGPLRERHKPMKRRRSSNVVRHSTYVAILVSVQL